MTPIAPEAATPASGPSRLCLADKACVTGNSTMLGRRSTLGVVYLPTPGEGLVILNPPSPAIQSQAEVTSSWSTLSFRSMLAVHSSGRPKCCGKKPASNDWTIVLLVRNQHRPDLTQQSLQAFRAVKTNMRGNPLQRKYDSDLGRAWILAAGCSEPTALPRRSAARLRAGRTCQRCR